MAEEADAPFAVHVTGETTGETWTGDFRAKKRLSHRDHLKKDSIRRELLGSQGGMPTERAMSTATILAELTVRLTKKPDWWTTKGNGLDLEDDEVLGVVFDKAMAIEATAKAEKEKKAVEAIAEMRAEAEAKAKTE